RHIFFFKQKTAYEIWSSDVCSSDLEIGVRMALGAESRQVLRLVVKQGLLLSLIGIATGISGGLALMQFLRGLLYGVSATSIGPYAAGSLIFVLVAMGASYIPARCVAHVDPLVALRYE